MGLARLLHLLGQALWIGGGLAGMLLAIAARGEPAPVRAAIYRLLAVIQRGLIAPGALLTVFSGLWLTMTLVRRGQGADLGRPGLALMQGAGIVGGILVLFVALPTAGLLAQVAEPDEQGRWSPVFERLRRRQMLVSSTAGVLALLALLGARLF